MKSPLVSTIIPIYNVELYLRDSIGSVVAQSVGFEDNIQLILIDDGSTDKSAEVISKFQERFPNNIVYKKQENHGVSSARNHGLRLAKGKFVHFFDGDDMLSKHFYKDLIASLNANAESIDFAAAKLKFFDEIIDSHPLNYKFNRTKLIDLVATPDNPVLHVISCLFRKDALENIKFDEQLSIAEDTKFLSDVLKGKKKYAAVKSPTYYYRKRTVSVSAIGGSRKNKHYYLKVPELVYRYMLDGWLHDSKAMEYTILYDLSYRLEQESQSVLSLDEEKSYKESIKSVIRSCSNEAILKTRFLSPHQKLYLLKVKYGDNVNEHITIKSSKIWFDEFLLYDAASASVYIDFLTENSGSYTLEGYISAKDVLPQCKLIVENGREEVVLEPTERKQREKSFLGDIYDHGGAFKADLIIPITSELKIYLEIGGDRLLMPISTGPFTRLGSLKLTYRRDDGRLLKKTPTTIQSFKYSRLRHARLELRMLLQIMLNWRFGTVKERIRKLRTLNLSQLSLKGKVFELAKPWFFMAEAIFYIPRAIALRLIYYIAKSKKERPIWIVSDRGTAAGDNGEALFRYIAQRDDCPADVYFVISKKSKDFNRLNGVGSVLKQESLRYKLMFLLSDKIIASQADVETTNPFIRQRDHYADLFNFDFVFLQHGVIRHNLSSWLNKYNKDIALFITSAQKEYDSIFSNPYYYDQKNVLLSGLARYDYLDSNPDGTLILAPTYRKNLVHEKTDKVGRRNYDVLFKSSVYRQFYNNVMNDKRILVALKDHNMKGEFYLHPVFSEQRKDFDENSHFKVMEFPYDYRSAFEKGSLLISDHSSVAFDFAYLKKPLVYAHFDADTFFDGHSYDKSNFFSDEDDGFGGVYYTYDELVEGVVALIQGGCAMDQKYQKRVDDFFYRVDKHNSQRIYEAILAMDT